MLYKSKLKGSFGKIYSISMVVIYILSMIEINTKIYKSQKAQRTAKEILAVFSGING